MNISWNDLEVVPDFDAMTDAACPDNSGNAHSNNVNTSPNILDDALLHGASFVFYNGPSHRSSQYKMLWSIFNQASGFMSSRSPSTEPFQLLPSFNLNTAFMRNSVKLMLAKAILVVIGLCFLSPTLTVAQTCQKSIDFSTAVATGSTQAPGVWYTDRYAPNSFTSPSSDVGGSTLKVHIDAADGWVNRPSGFQSAFYNTQGRKYDLGSSRKHVEISLYVPSSWATSNKRMAGLWGSAFNSANAVSGFPIVEFTSEGGIPRFRGWENNPGSWVDLPGLLPSGFTYDSWVRLSITVLPSGEFLYKAGDLQMTTTTSSPDASVSIGNVILQGHNYDPLDVPVGTTGAGVTYDIYWDDLCVGNRAFYVNDISPADDVFTTGIGNDANPGTVAAPFATVAHAVSQALDGDTIYVDAGTFNIASTININKGIIFIGAFQGAAGTQGPRGGESILSDVRAAATNPGAFTLSTTSLVEFDGFTFTGSHILSNQPANALFRIRNTRFMLQSMPLAGQTAMIFSTGCRLTLADNYFRTTGFNASNSALMQVAGGYSGTGTLDSVTITNNTFRGVAAPTPYNNGNGQSTLQLNFASMQGTISGNTFDGVDIGVLVAGTSGNLDIENNMFTAIKRDATFDIPAGYYGAGILIFDPSFSGPVNINGNTFQNSDCGIRTSNAGGTETGSNIVLSANTFTGNIYDVVHRYPTGQLAFDGTNIFGGVTLSSATLSQLFAIENKIVHAIDVSGYGLVTVKPANVYVTPGSFFTPGGTTTPSITRGIAASSAGFVLNLANGTYNEDIIINKAMTLDGESHSAIIRGLYAGSENTVFMGSSNSVIKDVTVTRDFGTSLAQWYASTKNQGINVLQLSTGIVIDNVFLKDNRNAIFINNAQNLTVQNCTIENNRTGVHFGNNITGAQVHNNFIRNNYTHGVLFNNDLAVNVTATNVQVTNNDISGNWYSQVNFQNTTNKPVGDYTGLVFSCNWYGTAAPAAVAANANEPGYAAQPPVQYGGTDPNLNRQLYGVLIGLCPYTPWLTDGTDSDPVTAGFQPVPGACNGVTQTQYYVNDNSTSGDHYTTAVGNNANAGTASAPLATIQHAINVAGPGATIWVDAGSYSEDVTVHKSLVIKGSNAGNDPSCDGSGHSAAASVVYPVSNQSNPALPAYTKVFNITASNVVIDGFTINGDNPSQTGAENAAVGIAANSGQSDLDIKNNIILNLPYIGVDLSNDAGAMSGNNQIRNNKLSDISPLSGYGIAVYTGNNTYADIKDNCMTNVRKGIQGGENNYIANIGNASPVWSGNTIESYKIGIWNNLAYGSASPVTITGNTVTTVSGSLENSGIEISSLQGTASVSITGNTVTGAMAGINLWNNPTSNTVTVGANTFTNCQYGVFANNFDGYSSNAVSSAYIVDGTTINGGGTGIYVKDNNQNTNGATVSVQVTNSTAVTSATAVKLEGADASISFNGASPAVFTGNTVYIDQVTNGTNVPASTIDATSVLFDGATGAGMTLPQAFATEDKINHKTDLATLGFVLVKAANTYVTPNSFVVPNLSADIQRGVDAATNGWTVNVADGTYNQDQLNVNKGLTVLGQSTAAIIKGLYGGSANTVLVSADNATLRNLTVTRNYGATVTDWYNSARNQGINIGQFTNGTRIDGVLVTGNRNGIYLNNSLGVIIENSTIEDNRTGIQITNNASGLVIRNNFIRNNFTHGVVLNFDTPPGVVVNGMQVNNNSITGNWYSQVNFQHNNLSIPFTPMTGVDISCNWYGTLFPVYNATSPNEPGYAGQVPSQFGGTDPGLSSDIRGTEAAYLTYQPFLTDGTDNSADAGFQPLPGFCIPPPNKLYVNDNSLTGDVYTTATGSDFTGTGTPAAPFATLNHAIAAANPGDTIWVDAGTYREDVVVTKSLKIFGSNYGVSPNTGTRVAEAIIQPATNDAVNNTFFYLDGNANDTRVDGFTFDGDNTSMGGGVLVGGVDVNAAEAIGAYEGISNDTISNNIIRNLNYAGVDFYNYYNGGAVTTGNSINDNRFENILPTTFGLGILIYNNCYTSITDNVMSGVRVGIQTGNFHLADPGTSHTITNNTIESARKGIWHNLAYGSASDFVITNNNITTVAGATNNDGVAISSIQGTVGVVVTDNNVTGARSGYNLWNCPTSNTVTISGGTLTGCNVGVFPNNWDGYASDATTSVYAMTGVTITGADTAIYVRDNSSNTNGATVTLNVDNATNIVNGTGIGLVVEGAGAAINFNGAVPVNFDGNLSKYIRLASNGVDEPAGSINAENVQFGGLAGSGMTLTQLYATEDKIDHKIDWNNLGFVSVQAGNDFVTTNSFYLPHTTTPAVQRGVNAASAGYVVNVAAGSFNEPGQVNIDKNVTVRGAGSGLTVLQPMANTTAGGNVQSEAFMYIDPAATVTLEKFGIDGAGKQINHAIQSRGALTVDSLLIANIKHSKYAGRGIVFYSGTANTVSNTTFSNIERIGIHIRGAVATPTPAVSINGITYTGKGVGDWLDYGVEIGGGGNATIQNSVITNNKGTATDGSTSAGILATTFFGPNTGALITSNYINNNTDGIAVGYDNTDGSSVTANYNDLSGNTLLAVSSTGPAVNATCNWFGTVGSGAIAVYVSPTVTYSPYLQDGTDAQPAVIGFQTTAACAANNNLYVNDNSLVGDHYTTAIGNDATGTGTPASPFATLNKAISVAAPGDTIWVDAGTYLQNPTVNKAVTIYGSNKGIPGSGARTFAESVIQTNGAAQSAVVTVQSGNVRIDGFVLDGDDPSFPGIALASGDNANASYGIRVTPAFSNIVVKNNIITKVEIGLRGDGAASGNLVDSNWFNSIGHYDFGYAVSMRTNFYVDVTNNKMSKVWTGVHTNAMSTATGPATWKMTGNDVSSYAAGLWYNLQFNGATGLTVDNNTFTAESGAVANNFGILMVSIQDAVNPSFTNNTITGTDYGIAMTNVPTSNTITLGATNTITGTKLSAILLSNNMPTSLVNPIGTTVLGPSTGAATVKIDGVVINGSVGNGIQLDGFAADPLYTVDFSSPTVLNDGAKGLVINGSKTAIAGNTLANLSFVNQSTRYIQFSNGALGSQQVDATATTFDGTTGAVKTIAQNFSTEDMIVHAIDNSTLGFVVVKNGHDFVTVNSFDVPATTSASVQRAVDVASAGWVTNVGPGTFTGQVEIPKDLTLLGQGAGVTTIMSPASVGLTFFTPSPNKAIIYAHDAAAINVHGVTVDGAGFGNANNRFIGIGYHNAGGSVKYNEVKAIRNTPFDGVQAGNAIYGFADNGTLRTWSVISNSVTDFQKNGITANGLSMVAVIDSNTITGQGATSIIAQNGVQIGFSAAGTVNNNIISDIDYTGGDTEACGILTFNNPGTVSITQNQLNNCELGVYVQNNTSSVLRNTIAGSSNAGIAALAGAGETTTFLITNNFISGSGKGVYVFTDPAGTTSGSVNENSITGSGSFAIQNDGSTDSLNANCNWFGTANANVIATLVSGAVDYIPYLTNGTDDDPATPGFQPVAGSCDGTPVAVELTTQVNVSCPGGSDGAIDISVSGGTAPYTFSWTPGGQTIEDLTGLSAGTYTVTVTDANGSTATLSVTITDIPDNTPPTVACATDVTVNNETGVCQANVVVGAPTVSDNCAVATVVNSFNNTSNASGIYPVGTTVVTWTVTDVNGNVNTCTQNVTVLDVDAPQFTFCPSQLFDVPVNAAGCVAQVTTDAPVATDNCGTVSLTWVLTGATTGSGSNVLPANYSFNVGITTIKYTATDASGNTSTCTFTVEVENNLAGNISGTATVIQNLATTSNITFSGTGGTVPYTFTYTVNGGSPQQITTSGANTVTTVPQSNAVLGQYIYTLVSITDAYGCTGVLPDDNKDTITVVNTIARPDLVSAVNRPLNSQFFNGQEKEGYVTITNVSPDPTTGVVTFRISLVANFNLEILGTTTTSAGDVVNNPDWNITTGPFFYTITSKTTPSPTVINGTSAIRIGYKLKATGSANSGGLMTVTILNGTGGSTPSNGDSNDTNNQSVKLFTIN